MSDEKKHNILSHIVTYPIKSISNLGSCIILRVSQNGKSETSCYSGADPGFGQRVPGLGG